MLPTYVLARDHLQRAASILKGSDEPTTQLRAIVERTIVLMGELERKAIREDSKVLRFDNYWRRPER